MSDVVDNYGTHNHENIRAWLATHPRFTLHFIPTSSSWLNLVERWFRDLTGKRIRRGSFHSVADLIAAIEDYIAHHGWGCSSLARQRFGRFWCYDRGEVLPAAQGHPGYCRLRRSDPN
jgi:transposase